MPRIGRQPRVVHHAQGPDQALRPLSDGGEIRQGHAGHHEGLRRLGEPDVESARRRSVAARQDELLSGYSIRAGSRHHGRTMQFGRRHATMAVCAEIGVVTHVR